MYRFIALLLLVFTVQCVYAQDQLSQNKVEKLYHRGTELVQHANYGAAREVFSDFLAQASPTDARRGEAEYYVAFSALNLGHKDGEKLIDDFIDNNPSSPKASTAYYDLATFFYAEGNYIKASNYYKKVNFPSLTSEQQSQGHFKWGYSYFNQKKLDEALEQFNFVKKQSTAYTPAANYYAGFIEYSKGLYDEAIIDLKKAELNPSYATIVPNLIANIYYKQKKYDLLIEYANSLKGRTDITNAGDIAMLVAEANYYKGDFKKAVDSYQKYFDSNAKAESGLFFRAGYANYVTGNTERGIEYLDKAAASKDTVSYYASYYLGILHLKKGNKPLALNAFDYARKNPKDESLVEESSFQFAKVSYDVGKADQAINEFERFLKAYPSSKHANEIKELLVQVYVNGNNFNKAIEYIEALPSRNQYINQAYQKAAYLKGAELFNKEEYAEAVEYFSKSLDQPVDKNYVALASFWRGEAYSIGRKFNEAIGDYQRVVSLGSSIDPEILLKTRYGLGYAHYNLLAYDKALYNFKEFVNKANKNTPNYADGLVRLADCYYVSKQYDDALATYNKAKAAGTADADYVLLQAGIMSGVQRKYAESRTQLTELIRNYPKSQYRDEAMFQRAQFEIEQSNYQAAVDALSQLIRESPNSRFLPLAYERRGAANYNLKHYDRTINDYQTVIKLFPTHPISKTVLIPLQEALNVAGRSGEFETNLSQYKNANPDDESVEKLEFETAKNLYFDQQYQKSITSFTSYLASYPRSAAAQEAKFYIAEAHYKLQDYNKALPFYTELNNDMTFSMGSRVVARLAEIHFKQGSYDKAVVNYHRLEKLATNKKEQYNAWAGLMESFYLQAQYDSVDVYARTIIERGNINAGAQNKASLYLGKTALARGDFEGAKDEFLNTLNAARDEFGAEAKYLLAEILYNQKEHKQCYETLMGLINDFSTYEVWVGKAFLLLADNFAAQNDVFQARATLQSLDKFPLQSIKDQAKAKLKQLEQSELEKQKKIEADTLDN
ncbi:tetratricopeptide repeat protein [Ohtaekwangia koreensis]|uniref:Tetratricopeptide repeat-containing protein n=1 Tax=Ohtaekwangia koreensis TaxID=688867 RepID=A0A1T5KAI7_9BACT|nr:tetratricopeptide repeat protein [Ohtaekwangia koreensis]SKC60713.1 Tetratricopeptide repeat-containing protein [Ohtaekwangia koreensis]